MGECPGAHRGTVAVPPPNPRVLTCQTVQALDDMLQALVMDGLEPNMAILQRILEVSGSEASATEPWAPGLWDSGQEQPGSLGVPLDRVSDLIAMDANS